MVQNELKRSKVNIKGNFQSSKVTMATPNHKSVGKGYIMIYPCGQGYIMIPYGGKLWRVQTLADLAENRPTANF